MTTLQSVQAILKSKFDLAPEALQPQARLEDLGVDSLAVIEVIFSVEDEFNIAVPSGASAAQSELKTVGDLVTYFDQLLAEQHPTTTGHELA